MGYRDAPWHCSLLSDCASISFASSYPCRARSSSSASRIISALSFCISVFAIAMHYIYGATTYQAGCTLRSLHLPVDNDFARWWNLVFKRRGAENAEEDAEKPNIKRSCPLRV